MYSGFAEEVPITSEQLILALDVVVPIQAALGELFCAPTLLLCRPTQLLQIELTNPRASRARVRVALGETPSPRELDLTLVRDSEAEPWRTEPASFSAYLSQCGAPASPSNR